MLLSFGLHVKLREGISYYVGQHGNNFGTLRNFSPRIEEITADKFLTWGFKKNLKHVPTFMFKTVGEKKKYDPKGNLVLIEVHRPYRYHTWDVVSNIIHILRIKRICKKF